MTAEATRAIWITGVSLVSSMGDGTEDHWDKLNGPCVPQLAEQRQTGRLIHPLPPIDFSSQFLVKPDPRRIGLVQNLGLYAAGQALDSAALKNSADALSRAAIVVGGAGGERAIDLDEQIFAEPARFSNQAALNEKLLARTRPSQFLSELPNLLAGKISIQFGITGGSRTTMGEELAGVNALKIASQLIADGAYEVALVGGSFNGERPDLLLLYGFGEYVWPHPYRPVPLRSEAGGGFILGTMAGFLVLESAEHARARGVRPWCRFSGISADHSRRNPGDAARAIAEGWAQLKTHGPTGAVGIVSGATGAAPVTEEELGALSLLPGLETAPVRTPGSLFGHGLEASFPFNVALGALALKQHRFFPRSAGDPGSGPDGNDLNHVMVTSVGHWRGEAVALLSDIDGS